MKEIQTATDPFCWSHYPGNESTANLLTRGICAKELLANDLYWRGPEWLSRAKESRLGITAAVELTDVDNDAIVELKRDVPVLVSVATESIFSPDKYSTLTKMTRMTA